jgi:anti-sigma factor RsiW
MDCLTKLANGEEILLDYASGALTAPRRRELEQHLDTCPACRELAAAQKELWRTLDAWEAPEPSPDFDARLRARLAAGPAPRWRAWFARLPWPAAAGAAAAAVLGLILWRGGPEPRPAAPAAPEAPWTEAVNVEAVEQTLEDLEILTPVSARSI